MGQDLFHSSVVFREALEMVSEKLELLVGYDMADFLLTEKTDPLFAERSAQLMTTAFTQPALFCIEFALSQLWLTLGIAPHVVMGHSLGELVAAWFAGVMSLDDALFLVVERGRCMGALETAANDGGMAAVFIAKETFEDAVRGTKFEKLVTIASHNTATSLVLSGKKSAIETLTADNKWRAIFLKTSNAFHSYYLVSFSNLHASPFLLSSLILCPTSYPTILSMYVGRLFG